MKFSDADVLEALPAADSPILLDQSDVAGLVCHLLRIDFIAATPASLLQFVQTALQQLNTIRQNIDEQLVQDFEERIRTAHSRRLLCLMTTDYDFQLVKAVCVRFIRLMTSRKQKIMLDLPVSKEEVIEDPVAECRVIVDSRGALDFRYKMSLKSLLLIFYVAKSATPRRSHTDYLLEQVKKWSENTTSAQSDSEPEVTKTANQSMRGVRAAVNEVKQQNAAQKPTESNAEPKTTLKERIKMSPKAKVTKQQLEQLRVTDVKLTGTNILVRAQEGQQHVLRAVFRTENIVQDGELYTVTLPDKTAVLGTIQRFRAMLQDEMLTDEAIQAIIDNNDSSFGQVIQQKQQTPKPVRVRIAQEDSDYGGEVKAQPLQRQSTQMIDVEEMNTDLQPIKSVVHQDVPKQLSPSAIVNAPKQSPRQSQRAEPDAQNKQTPLKDVKVDQNEVKPPSPRSVRPVSEQKSPQNNQLPKLVDAQQDVHQEKPLTTVTISPPKQKKKISLKDLAAAPAQQNVIGVRTVAKVVEIPKVIVESNLIPPHRDTKSEVSQIPDTQLQASKPGNSPLQKDLAIVTDNQREFHRCALRFMQTVPSQNLKVPPQRLTRAITAQFALALEEDGIEDDEVLSVMTVQLVIGKLQIENARKQINIYKLNKNRIHKEIEQMEDISIRQNGLVDQLRFLQEKVDLKTKSLLKMSKRLLASSYQKMNILQELATKKKILSSKSTNSKNLVLKPQVKAVIELKKKQLVLATQQQIRVDRLQQCIDQLFDGINSANPIDVAPLFERVTQMKIKLSKQKKKTTAQVSQNATKSRTDLINKGKRDLMQQLSALRLKLAKTQFRKAEIDEE